MMMSSIDPLKWKIGDSVTDVLISGLSFLDSKQGFLGAFPDSGATEKFLHAYGYDEADPIELAELQGNLQESIRFVKRYFLKPENPEGLALEMPKKILELTNVRELLLLANGGSGTSELRHWACALLRVVHIISHVDRDMRNNYFGEIQKQIFDRFYRFIHRDDHGQLYLGRNQGDALRVDLLEFQAKPKKARDSTLLKLLHKAESVAEEVFDRVGVRFVTRTRTDAIRVIHFLEQANVIVAANIRPSRSRNTLVDIASFKQVLDSELPKLKSGEIDEEQFRQRLEATPYGGTKSGENPFSSQHYRAIQFTCRQLIKLRNPLADQVRELKTIAKGSATLQDPALVAAIDRLDPKLVQRVIRFFYPFEIQVMDEQSFHENEKGRSAHGEYKKSQLRSALVRVMGALASSSG